MPHSWTIYVTSFVVSFIYVFLKGFQHKNVNGGHLKLVAIFSFVMAIFDALAISLVIKGGVSIGVSSGLGAALAMVCAIRLHDRIFRDRTCPREKP